MRCIVRCNGGKSIGEGRASVTNPWSFAMVDELLHGDIAGQNGLCATRRELLQFTVDMLTMRSNTMIKR